MTACVVIVFGLVEASISSSNDALMFDADEKILMSKELLMYFRNNSSAFSLFDHLFCSQSPWKLLLLFHGDTKKDSTAPNYIFSISPANF